MSRNKHPRILVVDRNRSLIAKVSKALKYLPLDVPIEAKTGDIFSYEGVIVSASNPLFTMGGGLDAQIAERFPDACAQVIPSAGNQRIGNVICTITVDEKLHASRTLVGEYPLAELVAPSKAA